MLGKIIMNGGLAAIFPFVWLFFWVLTLSVAAIGIVWSPFAAVTGALIARGKDMDVKRAALVSALYSILSIFLWLHFALRMVRKNSNGKCLTFAYWYAYLAWILLILEFWITEFVMPDQYTNERITGAYSTPGEVIVAMLLAGALAWIFAIRRKEVMSSDSDATIFSPPFVFSFVWVFAYFIYSNSFERLHWLNWWLVLPTAGSLLWVFWPSGPWLPHRVRTFFEGDVS